MPVLHWIGKEKMINHHHEVPFRLLEHRYFFSGKKKLPDQGNKIIHGDNLEALKALLPEYEGKINCIYIDPPYNTGNEGWVYNDNVTDPRIKKWLGQVVGREAEDFSRHDKWLCMMYPRLMLLQKLLSYDGVIFVSIDDHELSNLKIVMDEIFGPGNFIEYFSWIKTSTAPSLSYKSRKTTEYILCYEKRRSNVRYKAEPGEGGDAPLLNSGNAEIQLVFPKESVFFKTEDGLYPAGRYEKVMLHNTLTVREGRAGEAIQVSGAFKWTQETVDEEIRKGTVFIVKSTKFSIRYLRETETTKAPTNFLKEKYYTPLIDKKQSGVETNEGARKEITEIFGNCVFDYPKPSSLIEFLISLQGNKNAIVLDSFAGSGTTGHAVLNLNKKDKGNRKFILIEMGDYAETITAERIKRVIKGYGGKEGTGGNFHYYDLGLPLFSGTYSECLNEAVSLEKIREYLWYSETKTPYEAPSEEPSYFLGSKENTAIYFMYEHGEAIPLDFDSLVSVRVRARHYVIYAGSCLLPEDFMIRNNITFKKIPGDIVRF